MGTKEIISRDMFIMKKKGNSETKKQIYETLIPKTNLSRNIYTHTQNQINCSQTLIVTREFGGTD